MLGLGQGMEEISSLGPKKRPKGSEASHQPSQQEGEGPYCHRPGEEGGEGWGEVGGGGVGLPGANFKSQTGLELVR